MALLFKPVLGQNVGVSNLILKASLTYFMQYFSSISAYTVLLLAYKEKERQ